MKVIYENKVKALGDCVNEFRDADLFILFGDHAPEELRDYCYSVDVNPIHGTIAAGQILKVDDQEYKIIAVGEEVPLTLEGLGHCTVNFSGEKSAELPGTLCVEHKPMPDVQVGTVIQIIEP